jgi:prolyl 4-hydroxylase
MSDTVGLICNALACSVLGVAEGFERSSDVGAMKADGTFDSNVNEGRTSTNAWCQNACYEDEVALTVVERLTNITGINETNSECTYR